VNTLNASLKPYTHQKWVIADSGGPDSMALLDLAHRNDVRCIVVHVNYHKRDSADRDMKIVTEYCAKHELPCFVFDAPQGSGNFQDFARRYRYERFAEVVMKEEALGVLVAHHLNDDIETYVMQKMRNSQVTHFGLSESTTLFGVTVDRPLLKFQKKDLEDYCRDNGIRYGLDESNDSDDYLRNRLRKEISVNEIPLLEVEKNEKNLELDEFRKSHLDLLQKTSISMDIFSDLPFPLYFLQHWIRTHIPLKSLSEDHLEELYRQIQTSPAFKQVLGSWRLIKQYGQISVLPEPKSYTYSLKEASDLKTPFFEILTQAQDQHGFDVFDSDFPLTIRNAQNKETYHVDETVHKLSRWFISHKIPLGERESWPVVLNCQGEVIHIFRIRIPRRVNTHKTRLYMIK
jgi:tRNA(Ile)-lysidine synthetase-like protein